jgi:UDP-N-acetylmuramate--alanine ligase
MGHAHFVGVAGVGMSAVAQAAVACGWEVSGSDRYLDRGDRLAILDQLERAGISLGAQDGVMAAGADVVVVSTAIEADNADVVAATRSGAVVLHRSEMLAQLCEGRRLYAVAGTSGKSTVTGMLGCVLEELGLDPFVINGAPVVNWMDAGRIGNVRVGAGPCVIEADESDKSLVNYHPDAAVITNISGDHFPAAEAETLFRAFADRVSGPVVGVLHGAAEPEDVEMLGRHGCRFRYGARQVVVRVPGMHNAQNAVRTLALCEALGLDLDVAIGALERFAGVHRRLELVGERGGYCVIDDYGHNPAKLEAAWCAVSSWASPVVAVWRPHGYGPLRTMFDELVQTFRRVCRPDDRLLLLPVYDVGGTAERSICSDALAEALMQAGVNVAVCDDYAAVVASARPHLSPGACALVMGARDPHLPDLARALLAS